MHGFEKSLLDES